MKYEELDLEQKISICDDAMEFYGNHKEHVTKLIEDSPNQIEPSGSDLFKPILWKGIHWNWFLHCVIQQGEFMSGYAYSLTNYFKIKHKEKEYPWPCKSKPDRTITLFDDDLLTKDPKTGTLTKHTGLCCFGIEVPPGDIIEVIDDKKDLHFIQGEQNEIR